MVVDRSEAGKLGARIGDRIEIDGHRLRLIGLSEGLRSIGSTYVFLSQQTLRSLVEREADASETTSFVLAALRPGADADLAAAQLNQLLPVNVAHAWTRQQLSSASQRWWLLESGVGAGFLFSTALGLLIPAIVVAPFVGKLADALAASELVPAAALSSVLIEQLRAEARGAGLAERPLYRAVELVTAEGRVPRTTLTDHEVAGLLD